MKNELLQQKTAKPANLSEDTLIDLSQPNGVGKTEAESSHENVAKIEEYLRRIEDQKSLLLEKQKELNAKDSEIVQLTQISARQENDISALRNEVSRMKEDLSDQSQIRDEISTLNKSLCQMRDALNEKDQQLKSHLETISKLRSELSAVNTKLTDATKYQKMYEDAVTSSKADKIVAEEMMKNAKNELNASQVEIKNAKIAIEKYESELKANGQISEEKQKLEQQLQDYKNNLTELTESLEQAKKVEHEMHVQTANFLEEINKLKSKEDEYLDDIRKLKDELASFQKLDEEVKHLNATLEESQQQSKKLKADNEAVKLENASFKERIDDLHGCITQLEQSFLAKKKSLEAEQKLLETDRRKYTSCMEDIRKSTEENANLKLENARIVSNNEEISEKIGKLFGENKSLQDEINVLKENKVSVSSKIEKLKHFCNIDDFSDEPTILAAVPEKFTEYTRKIDELQTENEILKSEVAETKVQVEKELENLRHKYEMVSSEKRKLEERLSEEESKFEELRSQYTQLQNELETNIKQKEENERKILDLEEKLALSAQTSKLSNDEVQNVAETCSKLAVCDLEMAPENIHSLSKPCVDAILLIRSQLLDLKVKYTEIKSDLLNFCNLSTDHFADDELSLAHLMNVVENYETHNQTIFEEVLLLRKEKSELLDKIENLEKEIEDFKLEATENLHNRESFYKEKYSQEMLEIITGYEKRLAEKDNEYELLQNKMNCKF